ncbi:MAG: nucleotide exchange factor GrpE [Acidimicrobiales bacterium]
MGDDETGLAEDRQPGPVPQGAPPDEATPEGAPTSSGASPTGHPAASVDGQPPEEEEKGESAAAGSAPGDTSAEPVAAPDAADAAPDAPEEAAEEEKPLRAAERALLKRYEKERDEFREQYQRTRAEFENYRKRMLKQQTEHVERANEGLVEKLLPVLDNFDAAISHGTGYEQVRASFLVMLAKEGLERIDPVGKPFDPSESDAVAHEDGDGGPVVAEVLRPGYRWKGRVLRPAMVRVRG